VTHKRVQHYSNPLFGYERRRVNLLVEGLPSLSVHAVAAHYLIAAAALILKLYAGFAPFERLSPIQPRGDIFWFGLKAQATDLSRF
jgi:hypothetical protein